MQELALRLKPIVAAKAKERMEWASPDTPSQTFGQGEKANATIGNIAGVSHETIRKVETVLQHGDDMPVSQNSVKREKLDTQKELAKEAGVSHETIRTKKHVRLQVTQRL